jgi:multidrug efflux pump subunit AcrB
LKEGYWWEVGGELESKAETMEKLTRWMPHCFFGIIVLLVWQFNSIRRPLIIFITIPLAFVGGFIGLYIMQAPFDFFGMLGLLSLAGVIINNGIVLIDKIDSERAAGREPYDAVVMAALSRFRPITMATITTILGVMPLIVSVDPLFYAMACIIAFGLAVGTVLTLGVGREDCPTAGWHPGHMVVYSFDAWTAPGLFHHRAGRHDHCRAAAGQQGL